MSFTNYRKKLTKGMSRMHNQNNKDSHQINHSHNHNKPKFNRNFPHTSHKPTSITMNMSNFIIFIMTINIIKSETLYTDEDLKIVKTMGFALGIKFFVFVHNEPNVEMVEKMKSFSNDNLYSVDMNSKQLYGFLDETAVGKDLFERKMGMVTREHLNFTDLLQKVSGPHSLYWIVFVNSLNTIENSYIPMNAKVFVVQSTPEAFLIQRAYHLKPRMRLSLKKIGFWSKSRNLTATKPFINLRNLNNINFEEVTMDILIHPGVGLCQILKSKLALDRMECFQQEIIQLISERLNFTIKPQDSPEKEHPYTYPNGTLSALFFLLDRKQADISTASYVITTHRLNSYDFAWPTFTTKSMMYIKFRSHKNDWRAFVRPLDSHLWSAIISWIVFAGLVVQIFQCFRDKNFKFRFSFIFEMIKSVLESLQLFCNQGLHCVSDWNSDRFVYILTFFLCLIIYQVYSGHLISSLMVAIPQIPFFDLHGFFEDGTFKIITLKTGYHNYYFKKILKELGSEEFMVKDDELAQNFDQGVEQLCIKDNLAFVEFRENVVQHDFPCKITEIPEPMLWQSIGIGFSKNSPYRDFINQELIVLHTTGILQRLRRHLFTYVNLDAKLTTSEEYVSVSFEHVAPIFVFLITGVVVSWVVFLLEWAYNGVVEKIKRPAQQEMWTERKERNRLKMEVIMILARNRNGDRIYMI